MTSGQLYVINKLTKPTKIKEEVKMSPRLRKNSLLPSWVDDFLDTHFWSEIEDNDGKTTLPSVNITEDANEFQIEVAAPGMEKKDFNIDLNNNLLTISSEKEETIENKERRYMRREHCYTKFSRSFTLPTSVKEDEIKATYKNGILNIQIPKKEEMKTKPSRHIAIN